MKIGQLIQQLASQTSGGFIGNIVRNPKNENCNVIELRNRVVPTIPSTSGEKNKVSESHKKNRFGE